MKRKIIISIIILIFILMIATSVNAAVESKLTSKRAHEVYQVNAYEICYNMRNPTSSLGNNTLDPHLILNKEYGAYTYLGLSAYGANTKKQTMSINSITCYATTPNVTGVMSANTTTSYVYQEITAGVYDADNSTPLVSKYGKTKYMEVFTEALNKDNTKGMAIKELESFSTDIADSNAAAFNLTYDYRYISRRNIDYGAVTYSDWQYQYRPVIWN